MELGRINDASLSSMDNKARRCGWSTWPLQWIDGVVDDRALPRQGAEIFFSLLFTCYLEE